MCLVWDLGPENMDYCILKYSNHRITDLVLDDPWSQDSGLDFHQWLYLLVVAALNSTASKEVMQVIEKTSSSSSVNAFWMIIGYLAPFGVDGIPATIKAIKAELKDSEASKPKLILPPSNFKEISS
jgi:hypothetical protein